MRYYKLSMDMERTNDIVCHYKDDFGIQQNRLNIGKVFEQWDSRFEFYYDEQEGNEWSDYLANDKGWFVVSDKLRKVMLELNIEIQFLPVSIRNINSNIVSNNYYIANIIKVVDALCLDKSTYFQTEIEGVGVIYTVSKYGIYESKTEGADVFKLSNRQEIPIFVSEKFKSLAEINGITGISLVEISVV